jgi:hypothetical protein
VRGGGEGGREGGFSLDVGDGVRWKGIHGKSR